MATILITGGAGFLGFHLSKTLMAQGDSVICLDNFHTGSMKNIEVLREYGKIEVINQDVTEPFRIECDSIFNLACPASPTHYQSDPIKTITTNFLGAINSLNLASELNISILQASTSEIYGDPSVHPQVENYWGNVNPIGIRSCYDEGKRGAETLFFDYHRERHTKIKVARIFNTYGPRMMRNDGRVVSNFILQALNHEEITIYGQGRQTRSFCYVEDLVEGLTKLMNSGDAVTGPINLGNPQEVTMLDLAQAIIEATNSKSKLIFTKLPSDDPMRRNPDISLAKKSLNWEPKIDLMEGIRRTVEYFRLSQQ
jgi:UDP-glucuronate decarboxylase